MACFGVGIGVGVGVGLVGVLPSFSASMCPVSLCRFVPLPAVQHVSKIYHIIDMKALCLYVYVT
jgi:hypothetical protein